jgi:hydrogenase nickel incorporation protein HypB
METVKIIEVKENVLVDNDRRAQGLRAELKRGGTFLINLMSSPGSGKTSSLLQIIPRLQATLKIGIMEADIDSAVDAEKIQAVGTSVIQIHTGGMCHLDASMTSEGLQELDSKAFDLVVLENVGNLVCPAEFDTGAVCNMMILSVPEGDDKPLKYPLMFSKVDILIINKIDYLPISDFDMEAACTRARRLNPDVQIFAVSAKTGEGFDQLAEYLENMVSNWKSA